MNPEERARHWRELETRAQAAGFQTVSEWYEHESRATEDAARAAGFETVSEWFASLVSPETLQVLDAYTDKLNSDHRGALTH